ncbi:hypothetical protein Tco_0817710, partial [Tanacetum coccineum]
MDFHELVLTVDLQSIDSRNGVIVLFSSVLTFVGGVIGSVVVKYSSYKGLNSKCNSCIGEVYVSADGETFGTSVKCEAKDVKVFESRFPAIDAVI